MLYIQDKTPISYLQEMCTLLGIEPQYELVACEGPQHASTFIMQVRVAQFTAICTGPNRKTARHGAALCVLHKIQTAVSQACKEKHALHSAALSELNQMQIN